MSELEGLPGVGPSTAKKLEDAGFTGIMTVAVASPAELASIGDIGESTARKIIKIAREKANVGGFESGESLIQGLHERKRFSAGIESLDQILDGGIEVGSLWEIFGKPQTGKTQMLYQLSCMVQLSEEKGGLERDVIFIDTTNSFSPQRFMTIAEAHGLEPNEALSGLHQTTADSSSHQILLIDEADKIMQKEDIGLIAIDNITFHFVSEYVGRKNLAGRQQKLNKHLKDLQKLARSYNCAVVYTNAVDSGGKSKGGELVHFLSQYRILLTKHKFAKLKKSPHLPPDKIKFEITETGLEER